MQTSVTFKNLDPSENLKSYVADKLDRFGNGESLKYCQDILFDSKFSKYRSFLGKITDTPASSYVHGIICDIFLIQENVSPVRFYQPDSQIKCCGFSRSVWTKKTNYGAAFNIQANRAYNMFSIIGFA